MNIGQRIREVREDLGMQSSVLARRVGVAPNTIYRIEAGDRTPSVAVLEKIARELRTEPAEFLREPVHHVRMLQESLEVSDDVKVKIRLEEQFNALIYDLEAIRRSKEAAELARMRDEVLAAVP